MENEKERVVLSRSESRAVLAAQWLFTALVLINAGFAVFSFREISHVGVRWIVFGTALSAVDVVITVAFVVLFIKRLVHIKPYRKKYIAAFVLFVLFAALEGWRGAYYTADLFGGTREVVTNEFTVAPAATIPANSANARVFLFADGEDMVFYVPKEKAAELREIPLIVPPGQHAATLTENGYLLYAKEISVKYYPHSGVLSEVLIINE